MAERNLSERERRELANAHRGEVIDESAEAVEPRRIGQVVSLRLESDTISALRDIANRHGLTMSDLLRDGARMVIEAAERIRPITDLSFEVMRIETHLHSDATARHTANPVRIEPPISFTA